MPKKFLNWLLSITLNILLLTLIIYATIILFFLAINLYSYIVVDGSMIANLQKYQLSFSKDLIIKLFLFPTLIVCSYTFIHFLALVLNLIFTRNSNFIIDKFMKAKPLELVFSFHLLFFISASFSTNIVMVFSGYLAVVALVFNKQLTKWLE